MGNALAYIRAGRARRERHLVAELGERRERGGGPGATLEAVPHGQVGELVVPDGARLAGGKRPRCGWRAPSAATVCPECGAATAPLPAVLERPVERVVDETGRVEVVHGTAAERLRVACGGRGAYPRVAGVSLRRPSTAATAA